MTDNREMEFTFAPNICEFCRKECEDEQIAHFIKQDRKICMDCILKALDKVLTTNDVEFVRPQVTVEGIGEINDYLNSVKNCKKVNKK